MLSAYNVHLDDPLDHMYDRNNEAASMGEMNNSMYNIHDADALRDAPAVSMHP